MTDFRTELNRLSEAVKCRHVAIDIASQGLGISTAEVSLLYQGIRKVYDAEYVAKLSAMADNPPYPGYVTVLMMARYLGISKAAVHKHIVDGKLDKPPVGSHNRYLWRDLPDAGNIWSNWIAKE